MTTMPTATTVFQGRLDPNLQLFESSAPTITIGMDALLQWLRTFNPTQQWHQKASSAPIVVNDVTSWFPSDECAVFYDPPKYCNEPENNHKCRLRKPLTYAALQRQIKKCPSFGTNEKPAVVAILLPPCCMAEMAVVLVSLLAQPNVTVAPLDYSMTHTKLKAALQQLACTALVSTTDMLLRLRDVAVADGKDDLLETLDTVYSIEPTAQTVGVPIWTWEKKDESSRSTTQSQNNGTTMTPALLLRTSGTTSTPKVVPLTLNNLLYNALCLASSLRLRRDDIGCNAMPLHHIGGISCALLSVLVSGSSIIMARGTFQPDNFLECLASKQPTWYYGVPSMHKALILTAKARNGNSSMPNGLRFIRSGASYLSPDVAYELSKTFGGCKVIPTYSMSECMPICSGHDTPVTWHSSDKHKDDDSINERRKNVSVGPPIGCDLAIVHADGTILSYGQVGEVALRGSGVMGAYAGISTEESHTPSGWLLTGDAGVMDRKGNVTLTGRLKEVIKKGGEQVWPREIDRIVERVPGVDVAVAFGVPNPLWGEEVAVAVVASNTHLVESTLLKQDILAACKTELESVAVPSQIVIVQSTQSLPKGSTGKYLRTQMATHLGIEAVDVAAYNALENMAAGGRDREDEMAFIAHPSSALNGVRFLVACFVVQLHIGLYPSIAWLKIQSFSFNMIIFFLLGALQLACTTRTVKLQWSKFVGVKIGSMHALFIVTQLIALPSYLLFTCGSDGYSETFDDKSCAETLPYVIPAFLFKTATGLLPLDFANPPAWFQGVFYVFLMLFPFLNARLRSNRRLKCIFVVNMLIATFAFVPLFNVAGMTDLNYTILSWLPTLVCGMIAGYAFVQSATMRKRLGEEDATIPVLLRPKVWGWITDVLSVLFLLVQVANVMLSSDCLYVAAETFKAIRPEEDMPSNTFEMLNTTYYRACSITYDEFVEFVHTTEDDNVFFGRWGTTAGVLLGFCRMATPAVLVWLYGMSHGQGLTARVFNNAILQKLSHLAYPMYLLHVPIGRYYWYATRGTTAEHWWNVAGGFPLPVEWWEVPIIIVICLILGYLMDHYLVQHLSRYTVKYGVVVCEWIMKWCCGCCCGSKAHQTDETASPDETSHLVVVQTLVEGLTGSSHVDASTELRDLGLDSLGATALLGILKANIPAARRLSLPCLANMTTVGDLIEYLEAQEPPEQLFDVEDLGV